MTIANRTSRGRRAIRTNCILLVMAATGFAQSGALSLSSGSGSPGSIVTIQMSLNSTPGAEPASLQWVVNYPAGAASSR